MDVPLANNEEMTGTLNLHISFIIRPETALQDGAALATSGPQTLGKKEPDYVGDV